MPSINSKTAYVIDKFSKESGHGFLSNFHQSTIYIDGVSYSSVEHAYQAHKTLDIETRNIIRSAKSSAEAKKLGRCLMLRPDWEEVKLDLMRSFIRQKFENPFLRPQLLATGDADLINGNTWNDTFFGVCRGVGQNWLGKILMDERERILKNEHDAIDNVTS
jgi:hypothetical protein